MRARSAPPDGRESVLPGWLAPLLGVPELPEDGSTTEIARKIYLADGPVLRAEAIVSADQAQTAETFGFKWHQLETFESDTAVQRSRDWLIERYGDVAAAAWWDDYEQPPVLLDAGCGAALSSLALFGSRLLSVRYVGADISHAVDVAVERCADHGVTGAFLQDDLTALPLRPGSVDVLFSEGVLHHTDSTRDSLLSLASLLAAGGRFLFYVYRRKGPIREFTDDYIRSQLQDLSPEAAWKAVEPLTRLGIALGELGAEIEVPEDVELLDIPAGRYDVQRLFYWHVAKAFHHPDLTFDELNHINYDWYAPANAHRQTPEEVRAWCAEAGLAIEREHVEEAGITVIARREG
jgi:arsenite methyltransferase